MRTVAETGKLPRGLPGDAPEKSAAVLAAGARLIEHARTGSGEPLVPPNALGIDRRYATIASIETAPRARATDTR